jgi:molecular chaperone DnaK (HSP70)
LTKARAHFSIGIDLGTTNSALAFMPLEGEGTPEILLVPQWESLSGLTDEPALPSFLYLPEDAVAAHLRGREAGGGEWIVGRFARRKVSETPGRVVHSAKSWLCHHTADRSAPFLPWGSADLAREQKISPVGASALILNYLRGAWNGRFAETGFAFDDQEITVTVPASFDAAAQRLTIAAAEEAGFPDGVRLLEEPQAAFYCWLERHDSTREFSAHELWRRCDDGDAGLRHVLVIDIGGGTSDFSLFELHLNEQSPIPGIRRVAVSEHILLGGDNVDLAIAHFLEPRLAPGGGQLSGAQWQQVVASCCDLKERALAAAGPPDERFAVAVAGRGSGLVAGSQTVTVTRAEIENLLMDGFFPGCDARARPYRTQAALREWGLPYPSDSAVTRHLAEFLKDRPRVDAILFNGGSLRPLLLRERLRDQIGAWQGGFVPHILENDEPALAVARGAARFGTLLHRRSGHIAAGAARAVFLEVQGTPAADGEAAHPSLVCVLPQGASPSETFEIADLGIQVRTDQPVRFQAYSSSRRSTSRAGDIVAWCEDDFHALPPLQTIVRTAGPARPGTGGSLPVRLVARMNALGLLQISCVSADPGNRQSWPLEFNMRPHGQDGADAPGGAGPAREAAVQIEPNAAADALKAARKQIGIVFTQPPGKAGKKGKVTAGTILKSLEPIIGSPRSAWNGPLLRALWPALDERFDGRRLSVDHEEAWLIVAGFLLRPGFGVVRDDLRIDALWRLHDAGPCFPGRRIKCQEYILWRRVAGGITRERQDKLLAGELDRICDGKAPDELVRLAGSLELIPHETKAKLFSCFVDTAVSLARAKQHCAPYLAALGLLLNRAPLYGGPETVVSPDFVERAYSAFKGFDWTDPELQELQTLFLRAARVVGDRSLDLPIPMRNLIAGKMEKSGVPPLRTAKIRAFVPVGRSDRASLYDESLPPGLILGSDVDG